MYDNSNNVSGVTDPVGQLTTETSYSGGSAYTIQQKGFNVFGESLGETVTLPAAEGALAGSYTLTHTYTATTGLPFHDTYPATPGGGALPAETVGWTYLGGFDVPNGMGGSINSYVQNVTYTAFSQVAQEELGTTTNNAYITSTYDPNTGNLTDTQVENTAVSTTPFDDTSYKYDPAGNITAQTDTRNGSQSETQCFTYDTLDRLTEAWTATDNCAADPSSNGGSTVGDQIPGGAYWTSWKFDPLGDQTTQTQHSLTGGQDSVTSYSYNGNGASQPNTLTSASTTGPSGTSAAAYAYDGDGNTTTRTLPSGKQTLTWTDDGKLASDTTSAGTTSYIYDADGNLLLQKDPGQVTFYPFGGAEQIVLNTSTGAITGTRFLSLPGGGLAVRTGAGTAYSFEITDQHGTSLLSLDHTAANPTWRQYTPYGAPRGQAPASWPDTNAFLGKPTDANTGLDIIGARQYDPTTGRFLSVDPILDPTSPQTLAGYTYAADNPITQADPTGLLLPGGAQCGYTPSDPCQGSGGGGGGNGHDGNGTPTPTPSCPDWEPGCPGFTGGGAPTGGESLIGSGYNSVVPDVHAVAARYTQAGSAPGLNSPGCTPLVFKYGACPSERAAAGNTPQEVRQSALGALGALLGAIPLFDFLDATAIGGAAEDSGLADAAAASCGGMSFSPGTKVLLASGLAVPIAILKPGEKVLATNVKTGKTSAEPVTAVLVHHDTNRYDLRVKTAHGTAIIHTTTTHLFWNPATRRWVKAAALGSRSRLRTPGGTTALVVGGYDPNHRIGWMWDLTVRDDHDFYIRAAGDAVLVHNCPDAPGGGAPRRLDLDLPGALCASRGRT